MLIIGAGRSYAVIATDVLIGADTLRGEGAIHAGLAERSRVRSSSGAARLMTALQGGRPRLVASPSTPGQSGPRERAG